MFRALLNSLVWGAFFGLLLGFKTKRSRADEDQAPPK
jgi:hypothetical protein